MITATYSPEDNKIRLYPSERLDDATFARVKEAGFRWAPKQELFVAPMWNVKREDLAIELAGELEPEQITVAERAQAKAARLEDIAANRSQQADAFSKAARDISERFAMGQPILAGHHSERKAEKDKERMNAAQSKAVAASEAVGYWLYKATGVERHANMKNNPRVRANRIQGLLKDLRKFQGYLNTAHRALATWQKMNTAEQITGFLNYPDLAQASYGMWSDVTSGKLTPEEAKARCVASCEQTLEGTNLKRWINHTLNRLSYEREMLGDVPRFDDELTPVVLQAFVREHGGEKPKGKQIDDDLWSVTCKAPLPAHIANDSYLEMTGDEWRDLMHSCGYVPPAKKASKPPILNVNPAAGEIVCLSPYRGNGPDVLPVVHMTKAEYSKNGVDYRGTRFSICGEFRVKICPNPTVEGPRWSAGWCAVFLTDSKVHDMPDSLKAKEVVA